MMFPEAVWEVAEWLDTDHCRKGAETAAGLNEIVDLHAEGDTQQIGVRHGDQGARGRGFRSDRR